MKSTSGESEPEVSTACESAPKSREAPPATTKPKAAAPPASRRRRLTAGAPEAAADRRGAGGPQRKAPLERLGAGECGRELDLGSGQIGQGSLQVRGMVPGFDESGAALELFIVDAPVGISRRQSGAKGVAFDE